MKRYFIRLKSKIDALRSERPGDPRLAAHEAVLWVFKIFIVLTRGAGFSFPLIYQSQGARSTIYSYNDFKSYQKKVRIIFILGLIFLLTAAYIY